VEPLAGKTHIPCPYCATTVTIPDNLRTKDSPVIPPPSRKTTPYFIPPPSREGDDITDVLNQVKPLAAGALSAYGLWAMLRMLWRRVVPACAVILMILCLLVCGVSVILIFVSQRGA
jgi:hypothetical protein